MTIKLGLIVLGSLLIYAGWKNLSVQALIRGDNTVQKTSSNWAQTPTSTSSSGASASGGSSGGSTSASQPNNAYNSPTTSGNLH